MDQDPDVNPYESPKAPGAVPQVQTRITFREIICNFTVHTPQPHEVEILLAIWTGLEVYRIDGVERLRVRNFRFKSVRKFIIENIENAKIHELMIVIAYFPRMLAHVLLDGQPIIDDMFRDLRLTGHWGCVIVGSLLIAALTVMLLYWLGLLGAFPLPW